MDTKIPDTFMMNIFENHKLIPIDDYVGRFIAILGKKGSGKSNSGAVIIEEMLKTKKIGMTIIDLRGEYWGLATKFEILIASSNPSNEQSNIPLTIDIAAELAETVLRHNLPIILDISNFLEEERYEFLNQYFQRLWEIAQNLRKPHIVILEEAKNYIPQGINSPLKQKLVRIATEGRMFGFGAIILDQRSALIDKNFIGQADIYLLHRIRHASDFDFYSKMLNKTIKEIQTEITNLNTGECYYIPENGNIQKLQVRLRETFHVAYTPSLDESIERPPLITIEDNILQMFQNLTVSKKKRIDELDRLKKDLELKEATIFTQEKKISNLEQQLEMVSRFKIDVNLPTQQTIEKAVIHQLQTRGFIKTELTENESQEQTYIENNSDKEDIIEEKTSFNILRYSDLPEIYKERLERIKSSLLTKTKSLDFKSLDLLESIYPRKYSTEKVAAWLGISYSHFRSNYPKYLLELEILKRDRVGSGQYEYQSNIRPFLNEEFEIYRPELQDEEFNLIYKEFKSWIKKQGE